MTKIAIYNEIVFSVLMLTTGSSFLLTPASGEKLLVSGISLVGTILYLIYFANTLPFHQSSVPIIGTTVL